MTTYPCSRCGKRPHEYGSSICGRCRLTLRLRQLVTDVQRGFDRTLVAGLTALFRRPGRPW